MSEHSRREDFNQSILTHVFLRSIALLIVLFITYKIADVLYVPGGFLPSIGHLIYVTIWLVVIYFLFVIVLFLESISSLGSEITRSASRKFAIFLLILPFALLSIFITVGI